MRDTQAMKFTKISALAALVCALGAPVSLAQTDPKVPSAGGMDRPALISAMEECESGARDGVLTGRALGACDVVLRSPELSDSIRARVLVNRGVIALARNEAGPARGDLEQATELAPELAEAWLSLSAARIKARALPAAIEAAQRALDLDVSEPALAHLNIAIAEETAGQFDAAYTAYLRAAELAPDDAMIQAQPARFRRHQSPAPAPSG